MKAIFGARGVMLALPRGRQRLPHGSAGHTPHVDTYPADAYAPSGVLWWDLTIWPGTEKKRFGQVPRVAAWLWFNKEVGERFTMNELREALGPEIVGQSEHLNRRLRKLREAGWTILSQKDAGRVLERDEYRIDKFGSRYWIDAERNQQKKFGPSARVRRLVIERDGSRCVLCGVAGGETYPGEPGRRARLTIGHRVPQERLRIRDAADDLDNWRTECALCNETVRDQMPDPHRYDEVLAQVRGLRAQDKRILRLWLTRGERGRNDLDRVYDLARLLGAAEREELRDYLEQSAH
ncbi:HNH endonuclease [Promicromonospora kroppenstedtii]|uniref:HNH endonuclease n=1 Tax=Promicromonospora kroppenstedtii TaxID=440482 RepID=A0ABW7XH94_9MICO